MEIEYDIVKNQINLEARGIDFESAHDFDFETAFQVIDDRKDYGETRYRAIGFIRNRLHALVYTRISNGIRVISLRKANRREIKLYEQKT